MRRLVTIRQHSYCNYTRRLIALMWRPPMLLRDSCYLRGNLRPPPLASDGTIKVSGGEPDEAYGGNPPGRRFCFSLSSKRHICSFGCVMTRSFVSDAYGFSSTKISNLIGTKPTTGYLVSYMNLKNLTRHHLVRFR